ncbi:uroporphyrinogen-III C-methyltransferase [Celerinatantimonas yamalensis]|uniref:uroporphyrinogen-III C-methyltransferase n=1 Tax=Celerinatantimonas yamalensis TaxID=559956 RepID=A0ABW9GAF1_9GAMM
MALFSVFSRSVIAEPRVRMRQVMRWAARVTHDVQRFWPHAQAVIPNYLQLSPSLGAGEVALVGSGPGGVELLTMAAFQMLNQADVVVYDRLVSDEILQLIPANIDTVCVGKAASFHSVPQSRINEILIERAQRGQRVVRLKGGDSFIFGRGGEELEQLAKAGVIFRVIPGITAASGCTSYAGIPLTHRDYAQAVTFVTGHCQHNGQPPDWHSLVASNHTLVVYMGRLSATSIQQALLAQGMSEQMPVAVIENGTRSDQRIFSGTLIQLAKLAEHAASPALLVVGEVVRLHQTLDWFNTAAQKIPQATQLSQFDN